MPSTPLMRATALALGLAALACSSPSQPTKPEPVSAARPVAVNSVAVRFQTQVPKVLVEVKGKTPEPCYLLTSASQSRQGNAVTLTVLVEREAAAVCPQVVWDFSADFALEGAFPPGDYVLKVNGVETAFHVQ
jgi:membrane-associated protease RseP (regulator of RpoE activity)